MSTQSWYDVGEKPVLKVSCAGDLVVRGHTEASVVIVGPDTEAVTVEGTAITSTAGLKMLVPRDASMVVTPAGGDVRVKNVQGSIECTADVSGDAVLVAVQGPVTLQSVHGAFKARDVSESIAVAQVSGDVRARRVGNVTIDKVYGDTELGKITGDVEINEMFGDVALSGVVGAVKLKQVRGDCIVADLGGTTTINGDDDIRVKGPLAIGKHRFTAGSSIALRYPLSANVAVSAYAPTIINALDLGTATETEGALSGIVGDGGVVIEMKAQDRITMKPTIDGEERTDTWEGHIESEFDFVGIAEQIVSEVNTQIDQAISRVPEFSAQAEKALRQAEEAVNKLIGQLDSTQKQARSRATSAAKQATNRASGTTAGRPAAKSTKPESSGTEAARLKVLKMLEEGKITVEEAGELLSAME